MRIFRNRYALLEAKADQQKLIDWVGQELADEFFAKRKLLKSPKNDIYYWLKKEPQELADFLSRPLTKKQKEQTELERILAMPSANDVDLVSKQDGYEIYKINSPAASVKYGLVVGGRAKWCISGAYAENGRDMEGRGILQEAERYLDFYEYEDYFFIIGHGTKYALCVTSYAPLSYDIFDQDDTQLDSDESRANIPYLTDVYYEGDLIYTPTPEFVIENGVLIKYHGEGGDVVVPNEVREIGDYAFYGRTSLKSVSLPNVKTIGENAFFGCESLTSVEMPNVQTIGEKAFKFCVSLKSAVLPRVQTIGEDAFEDCSSLKSISLPNVETIGRVAFFGCKSLTSVEMPKVTKIDDGVLKYCTSLKSISLPNVETIGRDAFFGCKSLTSVLLPKVQKIRKWAFYGCTSLTSISLPNVKTIGEDAFDRCTSLKSVSMPNVKAIDDFAFHGCKSLTDIDINPNAEINKGAFTSTPIEQDVKERFGLTERYYRKRHRR